MRKLDKREKAFIELEMSRYKYYKQEIQKMNIKGLTESIAILHMQNIIDAVDRALTRCTEIEKEVYRECYERHRKDWYNISNELFISVETFRRGKRGLIEKVANELGIIKIIDII